MVSEKSSTPNATVKYLCSYGGKIAPRSGDGKLRYVGGHTRVLAVDRSLSFSELMVRVSEFCGQSVELRCQLPKGDLETLISIKAIGYPAGIHGGVEKGCYSYGSPRYPIGMAQQRVVFGCDSRRIWH
ncbi:hypothetical protein LINGRAHAP2_LOCUS16923 [Linum grandiflorum]